MKQDKISLRPLEQAFSKFETFRHNLGSEQLRAGAIQAFEYSFELSWKTMRRVLEERGKIANSPKETFRMAALENLIGDPELWFNFIKKHNITMYAYDETNADEVIAVFGSFSTEIKKLLNKLRNEETPKNFSTSLNQIW